MDEAFPSWRTCRAELKRAPLAQEAWEFRGVPRFGRLLFRLGLSGSFGHDEAGAASRSSGFSMSSGPPA